MRFFCAADTLPNRFGLYVMFTDADYLESIKKDPQNSMMALHVIKDIVLDLKYATASNFMKKQLYPSIKTTYLKRSAFQSLQAVQRELSMRKIGLKIWDAYRPYQTTVDMWEPIKDERFVANPAKGSGHNRGISVDLTLIDLNTGKELDMGTGFDDFSEKASHDYSRLSTQVLANRQLLNNVMKKHGFIALESEWWHYYMPGDHALMNFTFEQLKRLTNKASKH
jgi:D-alanyl-D-alanine dipeptidase